MALNTIDPVIDAPKKGSGGLWGTIGASIGAAAGLGVTIATAGAGAPLGATLASGAASLGAGIGVGQTIGGIAGDIVDPASAGGVSTVVPNQSEGAPLRTVASVHPEVQLAQLNDAHQAIRESTLPAPQANQYLGQIENAQKVLRQRLGIGGGQ